MSDMFVSQKIHVNIDDMIQIEMVCVDMMIIVLTPTILDKKIEMGI